MSEPLSHSRFFGDATRKFALPFNLILELEQKTCAGIGALCDRLFRRQFGIADIAETIRLALIGGGETPERAMQLVETYVRARPLSETLPVAIAILETLWFGEASEPAPKEPSKEPLVLELPDGTVI